MGRALAHELSACGIRCDFAPVMDVDTNPKNPVIGDRSFGDDPDLVARLGVAMIEGLQKGGVAACAKHFPGHGDTDVDSHLDLPAVDHSRARLEDVELRPFRKAIEAGVATIMTAHVLVRELDDRLPATLSPRLIDGLLREEMKYRGVVVSDDLEMEAVAEALAGGAGGGARRQGRMRHPPRVQDAGRAGHGDRRPRSARWRRRRSRRRPWTMRTSGSAALKERFVLPYRDPDPEGSPPGRGARRAPDRWPRRSPPAPGSRRGRDPPAGARARATSSASPPPPGPWTSEQLRRGAAELRSLGFAVSIPDGLFERRGFTAGSVERRLDELHRLFADEARGRDLVRAGRGGRGLAPVAARRGPRCARIPSRSSATATSRSCTSILARLGMVSAPRAHGGVGAGGRLLRPAELLARPDRRGRALRDRGGRPRAPARGGRRRACCAAGASPSWPRPRARPGRSAPAGEDTILFLEDVDERPYRIDRMLLQLRESGALAGVRGVVFGDMKGCAPTTWRSLPTGGRAARGARRPRRAGGAGPVERPHLEPGRDPSPGRARPARLRRAARPSRSSSPRSREGPPLRRSAARPWLRWPASCASAATRSRARTRTSTRRCPPSSRSWVSPSGRPTPQATSPRTRSSW